MPSNRIIARVGGRGEQFVFIYFKQHSMYNIDGALCAEALHVKAIHGLDGQGKEDRWG
jgi:hypothetical protein